MGEWDREDLMDELRRRTQAKGEKISQYLTNIQRIVHFFKRPPHADDLTDIVYRNLLPEYRKAMSDRIIDSLEDIEKYGRRWEKQKSLDERYVPPPSKEKSRIPTAAYSGTSSRHRVDAIKEVPKKKGSKSESPKKKTKVETGEKINKRKGKKRKSSSSGEDSYPDLAAAIQESRPVKQGFRANSPPKPAANPGSGHSHRSSGNSGPLFNQNWGQTQNPANQFAPQTFKVQPKPAFRQSYAEFKQANAGAQGPPTGRCFVCAQTGHWASECTQRLCFSCQRPGHSAKQCPGKPQESCQVCGSIGATFASCRVCEPIRLNLGNWQAGAQQSPLPPAQQNLGQNQRWNLPRS